MIETRKGEVLTVLPWQNVELCTVFRRRRGEGCSGLWEKKKKAALDPITFGVFTEHLSCPKHAREICEITNMSIKWA